MDPPRTLRLLLGSQGTSARLGAPSEGAGPQSLALSGPGSSSSIPSVDSPPLAEHVQHSSQKSCRAPGVRTGHWSARGARERDTGSVERGNIQRFGGAYEPPGRWNRGVGTGLGAGKMLLLLRGSARPGGEPRPRVGSTGQVPGASPSSSSSSFPSPSSSSPPVPVPIPEVRPEARGVAGCPQPPARSGENSPQPAQFSSFSIKNQEFRALTRRRDNMKCRLAAPVALGNGLLVGERQKNAIPNVCVNKSIPGHCRSRQSRAVPAWPEPPLSKSGF